MECSHTFALFLHFAGSYGLAAKVAGKTGQEAVQVAAAAAVAGMADAAGVEDAAAVEGAGAENSRFKMPLINWRL